MKINSLKKWSPFGFLNPVIVGHPNAMKALFAIPLLFGIYRTFVWTITGKNPSFLPQLPFCEGSVPFYLSLLTLGVITLGISTISAQNYQTSTGLQNAEYARWFWYGWALLVSLLIFASW